MNKKLLIEYLFENKKDKTYKSFRGFVNENKKQLKLLQVSDMYNIYVRIVNYQIKKYGATLGAYASYDYNKLSNYRKSKTI